MWFQNFQPKILKPHYQFFAPLLLHIYSFPDSTFIVCTVEHRNHIGEMAMVGAKSIFRLVSDTLYRLCVVNVNVNALVKTIDRRASRRRSTDSWAQEPLCAADSWQESRPRPYSWL